MICCSLVAFMAFFVSRMANHKYHTVNRNLGYELHLYRIKDYFRSEPSGEWAARMLDVGWEEAMCTARVVQSTLFNYIYTDNNIRPVKWFSWPWWRDFHWINTQWFKPFRLVEEHNPKNYKESAKIYTWYDTKKLIGSESNYHPGNYLRNIHMILHAIGGFSVILVWAFYVYSVYLVLPDFGRSFLKILYLTEFGGFNLLFTLFFISQVRRHNSFRDILESSILSIQSSAVVWRIVTTCHILGKECAFYKNGSYMSYTRYTYGLAKEATNNFYRIHKWLAEWVECCEEKEKMERQFDQLFPREKEPPYLDYLPGFEP